MGCLHPWREQSLDSNHFQIFFVEQFSRTYCCYCKEVGVAWQYLPFIGYHKWVNTSREVGELPSAASTHLCVSQVRTSTTTRQERDWTEGAKESLTLQPGALASIGELFRHRHFAWNSHWLKYRNYPETRHHWSRLPLLGDLPNYLSRACSSMPELPVSPQRLVSCPRDASVSTAQGYFST